MNNFAIEVFKNFLLKVLVYGFIWVIPIVWRYISIRAIFLAETVEWGRLFCSCAIECTLQRNNSSHCVILHIVREYHQLSNVDKGTETLVGEPL